MILDRLYTHLTLKQDLFVYWYILTERDLRFIQVYALARSFLVLVKDLLNLFDLVGACSENNNAIICKKIGRKSSSWTSPLRPYGEPVLLAPSESSRIALYHIK